MNAEAIDRHLVLRVQSGERNAFDALVRKYRQRVLKLAMRYVRNRADAEDAVQEAFLKAYGGLRNFRGDAAFYSWLHRIAINSAKTVLSTRARHAEWTGGGGEYFDGGDERPPVACDLDTPEELALTEEISGAVNSAVDALCEEQRTAIMLRELQGLSYAQVARVMRCPVGTVRSRVFRAREAIDRELREVFDDGLGRARRRAPAQEWAAADRECA